MNQNKIKHLMSLYIHKERAVDMKAAMTEVIQCNAECKVEFMLDFFVQIVTCDNSNYKQENIDIDN